MKSPNPWLDSLTMQDCLALTAAAGVVTHTIFKRTETHEPIHLVILLLGIPAGLTSLLSKHISSTLLAGFITYGVFWTSLLASIAIYRLAPWHPLYLYPGLAQAKLTKFWAAFVCKTGKQHIVHQELHRKYGNVVRVGPNELSICDVAAIDDFLGPNGPAKGSWWDGRFAESDRAKPLIALRDKTEHTRRRRPWTRAFSTAAMKEYEPIITERCQQLSDHLSGRNNGLDLMLWLSYFAFDLIGDLAFGGGTELMRDGDNNGILQFVEAAQEVALFFSHVPWLGQLLFRVPGATGKLKGYRAFVTERTLARKQRGSDWKDMLYYLFDEGGLLEKPLAFDEVISDGAMISLAGSDTTSTVLSCLFYLLLNHPTKFSRLREEIDSLGDERLKDCTAQAHLPYLTAVLNEAMRMYPPVLSGTNRRTTEPMMMGPYFVPKDTSVFIPFYALHRDPRYFFLPESFIPERWLSPEEQIRLEPTIFSDRSQVRHNRNAFVPFSMGPSNCAGKSFAWMEMRMTVCLLVRRFDMKFKEGYDIADWDREMKDFFITKKGELPIVVKPRVHM